MGKITIKKYRKLRILVTARFTMTSLFQDGRGAAMDVVATDVTDDAAEWAYCKW